MSYASQLLQIGASLAGAQVSSANQAYNLGLVGTISAAAGSISGNLTASTLSTANLVASTIVGTALSLTGTLSASAGSITGSLRAGGSISAVGNAAIGGTVTAAAGSVSGDLAVAGTVTGSLLTAAWLSGANLGGFRNRLINGNMAIDQRNAGAGTVTASGGYTLDRWRLLSSKSTQVQQVACTLSGLPYALRATLTAATTFAAGDANVLVQRLEGSNMADLGWGTANATPVTASFWANCSSAGNLAVAMRNGATTRSYVTTVNLPSANAWYYRSVTIPGETTGAWPTTTDRWGELIFSMGAAADSQTTSTTNAWQTGGAVNATGAISLTAAGASLQLTGVQLEAGPVATPFEYRPPAVELPLCLRYYMRYRGGQYMRLPVGAGSTNGAPPTASTGCVWWLYTHPVNFRDYLTVTAVQGGSWFVSYASIDLLGSSPRSINFSTAAAYFGNPFIANNDGNAYFEFSNEL